MAEQQQGNKIGFKSIKLFKDHIFGAGAYGKVCKAECDDLLCAAKLLHETLYVPTAQHLVAPQREHRLPMRRFEQECEFLSTIRHPNIVQYLGMYQDPDTHLPVILMELMDNSLTHFLETSPQPIPYHIQVNICRDIALALSFLHSNGIVHRDLSSNNVLMISNVRAKVTDFGMARLGDLNPRATHLTFTMCPGTDVYMPPEAVKDKPVYTEKIDCFSFGVIVVQILTRNFPQPGDRRKEIEIEHVGIVEKRISECERRQNDMSKVDPNHPLLLIVLDCLKDKDFERPSAQELCKRMATLQRNSEYGESLRAAQEKSTPDQGNSVQTDKSQRHQHAEQIEGLQQIIQSQVIHLEEKDQSIAQKDETIEAKKQEIQQLKQQRDKSQRVEREKDRIIEELMSEQTRAEGRIHQLELQLSQRLHSESRSREESRGNIKLRWREGKKAPCKMSNSYTVAVDGNVAYLRDVNKVYAYTVSSCTWSQLPDCMFSDCPSVIVNTLFTFVGGNFTNKLFSLTWEGRDRKWTEVFLPMPTKRYASSALCTGTALIVAGGLGESKAVLATVEVMNTETHQWYTAVDLPETTRYGSLVQVDDRIYMLGGLNKVWSDIRSVYTCSVSTLLQFRNSKSLSAISLLPSDIWSKVTNLPVIRPNYVCLHGRLLVVGGWNSRGNKPTSALHMYNPSTKSWQVISHMATPRYNCFAAVLPDNQLMVVGGETDRGRTDTVEIATVLS